MIHKGVPDIEIRGRRTSTYRGAVPDSEYRDISMRITIGVCCVENMVCGASSEYGTSGLISHTHSRSSSDLSTHHYYSA